MTVDRMSLEELSLLELLTKIGHTEVLSPASYALRDSLLASGLIEHSEDGGVVLTPAGVERCRSLQHRQASDREAARVLAAKHNGSGSDGSGVVLSSDVSKALAETTVPGADGADADAHATQG